jgi:hypothetical protein
MFENMLRANGCQMRRLLSRMGVVPIAHDEDEEHDRSLISELHQIGYQGTLAELMVKTNPRLYRQYVVLEKGRSVLYLRLQKALYGMMKSALLFYKKLVGELQDVGFEINPYDPCIVNKMVNGSQMTTRWHVMT